ncbi:MAG: PilT/PilU family type 4a pilus ATPase, partial [Clostridia bacterium]
MTQDDNSTDDINTEDLIGRILEVASDNIMRVVEGEIDVDEAVQSMTEKPTVSAKEEKMSSVKPTKKLPHPAYLETLRAFLRVCDERKSSDLHIKTGNKPCVRVTNSIDAIDEEGCTDTQVYGIIQSIIPENMYDKFLSEKEIDFSFSLDGARYRANAYLDFNGPSLSIRRYNAKTLSFEELGIPIILRELSLRKNGLILLTGPTGSGKSTTLAAIIEYLNNTVSEHIITLEDPIEFVHQSNKCLITQREVGRDTDSFAKALRSSLRQDPDVIMLGEMRDLESIATALTAAETGHLVLATLHTTGAENAIDRIIDSFPANQQDQIRTQLAMVLLCVVSQQLIPRAKADTRVLATELLITNSAVRSLIRQGKIFQIPNTMQTSRNVGMYTINQCLEDLYKKG